MPTLPFIGGTVAGTLYLASVMLASLWAHGVVGWRLALVSMGLTYLCYFAQIIDKRRASIGLSVASIVVGALAGIATVL